MNNLKKIGLTALAASLVSTSVFAGEVTVAGSASMAVDGYSGGQGNTAGGGKGVSMGNQLTFTGGGELDNGLTVGISFTLDQGDNATATAGPFDSHSVSVSSDTLGKITLTGEGGGNAAGALDTTAAGDIWDTFDGGTTAGIAAATGTAVSSAVSSGEVVTWALPAMVDGLAATVSYSGQQTGTSSTTGWALTYTGVEGLSVSYGQGDSSTGADIAASEADTTTMKASYAYGPVTVAYSAHDYDTAVASKDQETTSYKVSYTVSDAISISYGSETLDQQSLALDAEFEGITAAYTAGGMTVTAKSQSSEDALHTTGLDEDRDYWSLGLAFAF
jgi:outer membrane protein OmpU